MTLKTNEKMNADPESTKGLNSKKLLLWGFWVLLIGAFLSLLLPGFIAKNYWQFLGADFSNTGEVGDTIGGIAGPIISFMGAILVYLAFMAQIEANSLIHDQFKQERQLKHLDSYIAQFRDELKNIELGGQKGYLAIEQIDLWLTGGGFNINPDEYNHYKSIPALAKLSSALSIAEYAMKKLEKYEMDPDDKEICVEIMKHHFEFNLADHIHNIKNNSKCPIPIRLKIERVEEAFLKFY